MPELVQILDALQDLLNQESLTFLEAERRARASAYEPVSLYLNMLMHRVKPETAASEFFKALVQDVLKFEVFPEVSLQGGFIDFAIRPKEGNPVLLELKPLFRIEKTRQTIHAETLRYEYHQAQIQKYLLSNEYVMLTNLRKVFFFSREALIRYAPFYEVDFITFVQEYLNVRNIWEYIRRVEDRIPRKDLDAAFFEDLKKWYAQLRDIRIRQHHDLNKEELIVLFLNKMVFVKTLEDYGLIPFKFLEDTYTDKRNRWYVKGDSMVFTRFFDEIEQWFYYFYDTELFKTRFWDCVDQEKSNVQHFKRVFENVLGFGTWQQSFGKGMIHYNYRLIDEDVFGKAYESFLAEHRKDSGIYYTPQPITQYMAEHLTASLCDDLTDEIVHAIEDDDYDAAQTAFDRLHAITIIDPCSGSGSFLIKVLRELYHRYERIRRALELKTDAARQERSQGDIFSEPSPRVKALGRCITQNGFNDSRILISRIILHHIYAIDADERALDTAKTNIWKEAVKLEPYPFNFTKLPEDRNHILPSLELNFINGDSLADLSTEQAIDLIAVNFRPQIQQMHAIRDAYLREPFTPDGLPEIRRIKQAILEELKQELPDVQRPVVLPLECFFAYFDRQGAPLPEHERGLHAVISNPPWETIKPVRKELAGIGKYGKDIKEFNSWFKKEVKSNTEFRKKWEEYVQFYAQYREFLRSRYRHQGSGDLNYYKAFLERDIELLRHQGIMIILIPSGIQTDRETSMLRKLIVEKHHLELLYSFENKGYTERVHGQDIRVKPFPEVHPQFKFSILAVKKAALPQVQDFKAKFYLHHPDELHTPPIAYSQTMMEKFSPTNLSIMEFRSRKDYTLCSKIRGEHALLQDLGLVFRREFHMTDDSGLFKKRQTADDDLILYEGKMIHQYTANFATPRYYVSEPQGRAQLLTKEVSRIKKALKYKDGNALEQQFQQHAWLLDYERYRFVYRAVGSSTNERSLIGTIIPQCVFTGNSMNYLIDSSYIIEDERVVQQHHSYHQLIYVMALFNSLTLNFYIRNKISANLNMFYLYELPVPEASAEQKVRIVHHAFSLLACHDQSGVFEALGRDLGIEADAQQAPLDLRAALEVLLARDLFGLSATDWTYLTSTFVYGSPKSATRQELDAIIARSRELFALAY